MCVKSCLIIILLVEHKNTRILLRAMQDVRMIAWLFPYFGHSRPHNAFEFSHDAVTQKRTIDEG